MPVRSPKKQRFRSTTRRNTLRLYIPPHLADATPPTTPASLDTAAAAAPAGPSNLRLRIIWGVIGAALLLGSVWFSPWTCGLFFAAVQAVMLWEFYRMMRAGGYAPATWIGMGAALVIMILTDDFISIYRNDLAALRIGVSVIGVVALSTIIAIVYEMVRWPKAQQPFINVAVTLLGILYITVPMAMLGIIAYGDEFYDPRRIFALLFLIWASDIGAYAAGKTFGKHKMAPQISPGKTWEGWAGGFILTLIVGWAVGFMLPDMPLTHRLVAAGVVAVFAPLGDLAESMLKRSVGVKDSGSIMPGHGGLLDRFDAFLLVLPVLALLQLLAG